MSVVKTIPAAGIGTHADLAGLSADDHAQYLLVSGARAALTLEIEAAAPTLTFTDTDAEDWRIVVDGDNMTIENIDSKVNGELVLDHRVRMFPSLPDPAAFTTDEAFLFDPTVNVAAISNISFMRDFATVALTGIYSSWTVITSQASVTSTSATTGALYLFVSQGTTRSTNASYPPGGVRSFDHRPIVEADGAAVPNCPFSFGLLDIGMLRAINGASVTLDLWVTAGNASLTGLGVVSATAGASATVTDRVVFDAVNTNPNGDGGTEAITNQYGLRVGALTSGSTINCCAWLGGASGATANYGIVLDSDDVNGGAIWFGADQDAKIGYDGTDLRITASNARFTAAVEIDGTFNHDGANFGIRGVAPVPMPSAYTITNYSADKAYDANSTTLDELADVLATLILDLMSQGILQGTVT